jgi:hypothetical protein
VAQMLKNTKDFELVGGLTPGTVRVSTDNAKDEIVLSRCAVSRPTTAVFWFNYPSFGGSLDSVSLSSSSRPLSSC